MIHSGLSFRAYERVPGFRVAWRDVLLSGCILPRPHNPRTRSCPRVVLALAQSSLLEMRHCEIPLDYLQNCCVSFSGGMPALTGQWSRQTRWYGCACVNTFLSSTTFALATLFLQMGLDLRSRIEFRRQTSDSLDMFCAMSETNLYWLQWISTILAHTDRYLCESFYEIQRPDKLINNHFPRADNTFFRNKRIAEMSISCAQWILVLSQEGMGKVNLRVSLNSVEFGHFCRTP